MRRLPLLALMPFGLWAEPDAAGLAADEMWAALRSVPWNKQYSQSTTCVPSPTRPTWEPEYGYVCSTQRGAVKIDTFYFPVDPDQPSLRVRRVDFHLANRDPKLAVDVEGLLREKLSRAYGKSSVPDHIWQVRAMRPNPGLRWNTGDRAIFLHRNGRELGAVGKIEDLQLTLVDRAVLEEYRINNPLQSATALPEVSKQTEPQVRLALYRLLQQVNQGTAEERAARLIAADQLVTLLGALLIVKRGEIWGEADHSPAVKQTIARYGVRFTNVGHYSGILEQDSGLLRKAWKEYPETPSGQQAFLLLQKQICVSGLSCKAPNCFRSVIKEGEKFLDDYPDTPWRKEQLFNIAVAHETWWSLSIAPPSNAYAEGADVDRRSGEIARQNSITLYEQIVQLAPESAEARYALKKIPRLKLKLDTGERTFFCGSC